MKGETYHLGAPGVAHRLTFVQHLGRGSNQGEGLVRRPRTVPPTNEQIAMSSQKKNRGGIQTASSPFTNLQLLMQLLWWRHLGVTYVGR